MARIQASLKTTAEPDSLTSEIEQVAQKAAFFLLFVVFVGRVVGVVDVVTRAVALVLVPLWWWLGLLICLTRRWRRGLGAGLAGFDELVEFASVKPYSAARWAIVDLDPLPLRHC